VLFAASVASAQQGYFKQLESQGWSNGRSYSGERSVFPRSQENFTPEVGYSYGRSFVSPRFQENPISDQRVRIHLQVPASARVWFDNEKTIQTGSAREFITPPLPAGREYTYAVRAEWTEDGRKMESTRTIRIHAGDRVNVDLSRPAVAANPTKSVAHTPTKQ
jgi:uncharacterized protein (TIGR03000 family)